MDQAESDLGDNPKKHAVLTARQRVFDKYMEIGPKPETTPKGRFADPAAIVTKR